MKKTQNTNRQTKVALIGDSITELSIYPNYLAQLLGSAYNVGNFGASGTTIALDSTSPYIYTQALQAAKNFEPDIVVIMLGTNDAYETVFQANLVTDYSRLIENFTSLASKPEVYLVKPPPIFSSWGGLNLETLVKEILPAIEQTAKTKNYLLIDVFSALCDSKYFLDGVHPNDKGGKMIAEAVCHALTTKPIN